MTTTVSVFINGMHVGFEVTTYEPARAHTHNEEGQDEYIEWRAVSADAQNIIRHFDLDDAIEELILEQLKADIKERQDEAAIARYEEW